MYSYHYPDHPHQYCADAYYARAIEYDSGRRQAAEELPAEFEIPIRWIMAWLGAVTTLAFFIGGLVRWIA
jgi:hypothetical protein